jgi:hypothetical protein
MAPSRVPFLNIDVLLEKEGFKGCYHVMLLVISNELYSGLVELMFFRI